MARDSVMEKRELYINVCVSHIYDLEASKMECTMMAKHRETGGSSQRRNVSIHNEIEF